MAVDLAVFPLMEDQTAVQEAAAAGLKSMEELICILSHQINQSHLDLSHLNCSEITDFTVSKFKQVISILNRTGHARFRRGPTAQHHLSPDFAHQTSRPQKEFRADFPSISPPIISTTSSFAGYGDVSDGKREVCVVLPQAPAQPTRKPPLSSDNQKRCQDHVVSGHAACNISSSGRCHCSKRRKSKVKRSVRVPAISSRTADTPPDEYSWRKYGQKPIKGSPYPRGYYKCSSVRGCPAKKHVERATDDPTMLIVTYEGEHRHPQLPTGVQMTLTEYPPTVETTERWRILTGLSFTQDLHKTFVT